MTESTSQANKELIMQYLHTMVRVSDLDAALHFYCDLLGLEEVRRKDNEKGRFTLVFLAAPARRNWS
jgi:lactoylglutathione lyase